MGKNAKAKRRDLMLRLDEEDGLKCTDHPLEARLSHQLISEIKSKGLIVDDHPFFAKDHSGWPSGYLISKPRDVTGNRLPVWEEISKDNSGYDIACDMPTMTIWKTAQGHQIEVHNFVPGPGPGDFQMSFESDDAVLASILNYYFNADDDRFLCLFEHMSQTIK